MGEADDYYSVTEIPDFKVNGKKLSHVTQAVINSSHIDSSNLAINAALTVSGNTIQARATITPYVTKPVEGSFDFWAISSLTYQYVVYVQDEQTKEVLNSSSGLMSTGIVTFKDDASIGVYPNPAEDYAIIGIQLKKESSLSLTIYDISGKVVYNNEAPRVSVGQNEITINTANFASGMYTIVVRTADGILREKLMIN